MSCASACPDGWSRTADPCASSIPSHADRVRPRVDGLVGRGVPPRGGVRPGGGRRGPFRFDRAHLPVEAAHGFGRERVATVDDGGGPRVRTPGLGLLRVGERHHPQSQDLVDLECVVEVARTLVRHFGVVVEDDRRREHHVVAADEDWIGAVAPAGPGCLGGIVGRFEQRDELRTVDGQHGVHSHQALGHHVRSQ